MTAWEAKHNRCWCIKLNTLCMRVMAVHLLLRNYRIYIKGKACASCGLDGRLYKDKV